jgi:hypothetical protein
MYVVKVKHYDEGILTIPKNFKRKYEATRYLKEQANIAWTNEASCGWLDGKLWGLRKGDNLFVVFGPEGIHKTTMWVARAN